MTLAQIRLFSDEARRRVFARRAQTIHDMAIAFHGKNKSRQEYTEYLEKMSGR